MFLGGHGVFLYNLGMKVSMYQKDANELSLNCSIKVIKAFWVELA